MKNNNTPSTWTYVTAPNSPSWNGIVVSTRQLRRLVEGGKLSHVKVGNRVVIRDQDIVEFVEKSTVQAVR
jgi:excisionase family DNA binding protein